MSDQSLPMNHPSVLGADSDPVEIATPEQRHPYADIRPDKMPIGPLIPYGPGFAVNTDEIFRRGFKALDEDEKARVISAYLVNQKQFLSPFDTDVELAERQLKLELAKNDHTTKHYLTIGALTMLCGLVIVVISMIIYFSIKNGVLNDSGLIQGMFTMLQEVFRVVASGGKF